LQLHYPRSFCEIFIFFGTLAVGCSICRIEPSWWIFAVTGLGAMAITLCTISFQSIKAALVNPVVSLRAE
jgi:hypothetical protein